MQSSRDTFPTPNFARAFRAVRVARGVTQEGLDTVSSRTYVSMLERGINAPTLPKLDALVRSLNLHPLTVLALSYVNSPTRSEVTQLLARVLDEVQELGLEEFSAENIPPGIKPV